MLMCVCEIRTAVYFFFFFLPAFSRGQNKADCNRGNNFSKGRLAANWVPSPVLLLKCFHKIQFLT